MTPEEIKTADGEELVFRRLFLLRVRCPSCDDGQEWARCSCVEDLQEVDAIEREMTRRGISG